MTDRPRRIAALAGLLALAAVCGCEAPGGRHGTRGDGPPPLAESAEPLAGSEAGAKQSLGSWSSDARDIEKHLTNRSVNPNW